MRPRGTGGRNGWMRVDDRTPRNRRGKGQKFDRKAKEALKNSKPIRKPWF